MTRTETMDAMYKGFCTSAVAQDADKKKQHTKGRVTSRFWPTEASAMSPIGPVGRCRRRTYYSQQAVVEEEQFDIVSLGRFYIGNKIEDWVTELAKAANIYHANSVKISYSPHGFTDITVSGEVDLIYNINGDKVGGEVKTSYGYKFSNFVFHKPTIPGMPKVEHLMQTLMYLFYYKYIDTTLGITRFVITYVDRGSMEWIQHTVEMTEDMYPIVNGITIKGVHAYNNPIYDVQKMNSIKVHNKLSAYEFTVPNIFQRYSEILEHHDSGLLIAKDYDPLYTDDKIEQRRASGDISKSKYDQYKDGRVPFICDDACSYCPFRETCMKAEEII